MIPPMVYQAIKDQMDEDKQAKSASNPSFHQRVRERLDARNEAIAKAFENLKPGAEGYGATVGRLLVAVAVALGLIGALLGINWGGVRPARPPSVKPGINAEWKSTQIDPLVAQLESESREIYAHRAELAALVGLKPGMEVADVGAGSGFMTELFARQVGPEGKVFAVDINPALVGHVTRRVRDAGFANVQAVVTPDDSVSLRKKSVDLAFLCDTYHHFEYPRSSLRSIRRALRNKGALLVVDLRREPGKSPDSVLKHVRLGKEDVIKEIEDAGFRFLREEPAPFFTENYVLRFQKKGE